MGTQLYIHGVDTRLHSLKEGKEAQPWMRRLCLCPVVPGQISTCYRGAGRNFLETTSIESAAAQAPTRAPSTPQGRCGPGSSGLSFRVGSSIGPGGPTGPSCFAPDESLAGSGIGTGGTRSALHSSPARLGKEKGDLQKARAGTADSYGERRRWRRGSRPII